MPMLTHLIIHEASPSRGVSFQSEKAVLFIKKATHFISNGRGLLFTPDGKSDEKIILKKLNELLLNQMRNVPRFRDNFQVEFQGNKSGHQETNS